MNNIQFWNASIEEMKQGYIHNKHEEIYTCFLCGETYENGVIYSIDHNLYEAKKAIEVHMSIAHTPVFDFLLGLGRVYTGLSASQNELAKLFFAGHSDKEIVALTGANSASTIRNQRFAIREKYKQAKVLVALVELMEQQAMTQKKSPSQSELVDIHLAATNIDERYAITQKEKDDVLMRYFDPDNKLKIKGFPAKEKRKIIIMQKLITDFDIGKQYTENAVNEVIKQYYDDYASVRRCMIEYGFLDRNGDGTQYWVKLS